MPHHDNPFAAAVQTANEWVKAVADSLDTDDRQFAYRALRAWLHTVRDRIGINNSAHLSAQLPEVLRGVYYEGWVPSHVPVRHSTAAFITQFAREAGIERHEVGSVAGAVTATLEEFFSPGQLNRVFAVLPMHLYGVLCGALPEVDQWPTTPEPAPEVDRRADTEYRLRVLTDAVAALARGLERLPVDGGDDLRMATAAQQVHHMLLAEGLVEATAHPGEH